MSSGWLMRRVPPRLGSVGAGVPVIVLPDSTADDGRLTPLHAVNNNTPEPTRARHTRRRRVRGLSRTETVGSGVVIGVLLEYTVSTERAAPKTQSTQSRTQTLSELAEDTSFEYGP